MMPRPVVALAAIFGVALLLSGCAPCDVSFNSTAGSFDCTLGSLGEDCCPTVQRIVQKAGPSIEASINNIYNTPGLSDEEKRNRAAEAAADVLKNSMSEDDKNAVEDACGPVDGLSLVAALAN